MRNGLCSTLQLADIAAVAARRMHGRVPAMPAAAPATFARLSPQHAVAVTLRHRAKSRRSTSCGPCNSGCGPPLLAALRRRRGSCERRRGPDSTRRDRALGAVVRGTCTASSTGDVFLPGEAQRREASWCHNSASASKASGRCVRDPRAGCGIRPPAATVRVPLGEEYRAL